jgi:molecular chaperone DnaK
MNMRNLDHVIGIDLGTTMSAVSITDDIGNVVTIPNNDGKTLTPSAVLVTADEILVGQAAIDQALEFPNTFAECFKRNIGQSFYPTEIRGFKVPPEILCAFLIDSLKQDAEQFVGGNISNAVITVPAFYGSKRRQATRLAGELAGLNVLDIVNEPTAAALAYGYRERLFAKDRKESMKVLVFDLGGGTFDVSLLEFRKNQFVTLATDGNVQLGGRDFDSAIKDFVADQFIETYGVDPRSKVHDLIDLFSRCKDAKHSLSKANETTINCSFEGMRLGVQLTREKFEDLIESHVDLTAYTCESVLQTQQMTWQDLDHILFVGGSCRIPFVAQRIEEKSGHKPVIADDPDEIVAQGAALFAASKSMDESVGFDIVNVNSHSLGISGVDTSTGEKINKILIPRNTPLPAVIKQRFVTHRDGQRGVSVTLLEGESENPKYCEVVAKSAIVLNPNTPSGTDIEVICQYREDGTIHLSARIVKERKATTLEVRREATANFDSMEVWRARFLNQESEVACSTSEIPDLNRVDISKVTPGDLDQINKAIEFQFQEIGKIAFASTLIPELIPQRRAIQRSIDELIFFRRISELIEKRLVRESDFYKKTDWEGKLRRAKNELVNLERFAQHCRIVLGRECVNREFLPPGTGRFAEQIKKLQSIGGVV